MVLVYLLILIFKDPVNESALFGFVTVKFPSGKTELPGEASATDHFGKLLKGPDISGKAELSLFHLGNVKTIKIAFSFFKMRIKLNRSFVSFTWNHASFVQYLMSANETMLVAPPIAAL